MKKVLTFLYFFGFTVLSFSQNAAVSGTIEDAVEGNILPEATVSILGSGMEQLSDFNGEFSFEEGDLPTGKQVLEISKPGFENRELEVYIVDDKKLVIDKIGLIITKDERKERNAERRYEGKERISKNALKKKRMDNDVEFFYEDLPKPIVESQPQKKKKTYTPLQLKYAELLEVPPERISDLALYEFIDEWMGTPYLLGGNNKSGIDCSSFTLTLFAKVYDRPNIGRTAKQQLKEAMNRRSAFRNPQGLEVGDLIFFGKPGDRTQNVDHVGVYLGNNKFVNSTSRKGPSGVSGVKISDLKEVYWQKRFRAAGRW